MAKARPGEGVPISRTAADNALPASQAAFKLENIFPTSIFDAFARNDALQIVVFAFLFGTACAAIGAKADPVVKFCGSLAEVMFRFTRYVMYVAPLGRSNNVRGVSGTKLHLHLVTFFVAVLEEEIQPTAAWQRDFFSDED